ncbi:MAG: 3'-5' exonuclease, partial [bacterium]
PCFLLRDHPDLLEKYRKRFRFLLIDEFQDTNLPQGELARLLAAPSGNITAVGDDDQSIYGWRGAYIGNILQFKRDYQGVKTFKLEQNYRSTAAILETAHQVIQQNLSRHPKKLWTDRQRGSKPRLISALDEREESHVVIREIQQLLSSGFYRASDIVILYRTNAQSRTFEEELRRNTIPYVMVGGLRFYERKEVKDFLAFLRLLVAPNDGLSLERIINLPPRGIGNKTISVLLEFSRNRNISLFQTILDADEVEGIGKKASAALKELGLWITNLQEYTKHESLFKVGERLLKESKLLEHYKNADAVTYATREENLSELLNALREYSYESQSTGSEDLQNFLQEVALVTDIDHWNSDDRSINLMTLHAAKGLEFSVVFLTGLEDGLFPLQSNISETALLEEERRLFYVGATRAKEQLYLTYARNRRRWGRESLWQQPSRFLKEIPDELLEEVAVQYPTPIQREIRIHGENKLAVHTLSYSHEADLYPLGSRVSHRQFGEGIVIHSEGRGEGQRLLVNFERYGQKLLLTSHAKLQLLLD